MTATFAFVLVLIAFALIFDYINGFHDAANSIATVVSTRVLSPGTAVIWAAFFNFVAAFVFGTAVAQTVGAGTVDINIVTLPVIFGGLIGAYAGAAVAKGGMMAVLCESCTAWNRTIAFIVLSPMIGLAIGHLLMVV